MYLCQRIQGFMWKWRNSHRILCRTGEQSGTFEYTRSSSTRETDFQHGKKHPESSLQLTRLCSEFTKIYIEPKSTTGFSNLFYFQQQVSLVWSPFSSAQCRGRTALPYPYRQHFWCSFFFSDRSLFYGFFQIKTHRHRNHICIFANVVTMAVNPHPGGPNASGSSTTVTNTCGWARRQSPYCKICWM